MKTLALTTGITVAIVGGWLIIATRHSTAAEPIKLEPVVHAKYDPAQIDRKIAFTEQRVQRDPGGAIGWSMVAESWLARSRESDSDAAAWKAEEAARKSLNVRVKGNFRGRSDLVDSLLEQHRFQDALAELEANHFRTRQYADVLCEVGRLDEAEAVIATLPKPNEDPSIQATKARIASLRGDHRAALAMFQKGLQLNESNPGVGNTTLAWFKTKLAGEYRKSGNPVMARTVLNESLALFPRSYKAHLALAEVNLGEGKYAEAISEAEATLKIANSLDARAVIGDAQMKMGDETAAEKTYSDCRQQYLTEVALFDKLHKGGKFMVRPIDRQFATFSVKHNLFGADAKVAAKRDLANRPDELGQANAKALGVTR